MVVTRNGELAERMRVLTNQGQTAGAWSRYTTGPIMPYEVIHDGYKGNMPDILASTGLAQDLRLFQHHILSNTWHLFRRQ